MCNTQGLSPVNEHSTSIQEYLLFNASFAWFLVTAGTRSCYWVCRHHLTAIAHIHSVSGILLPGTAASYRQGAAGRTGRLPIILYQMTGYSG